MLPAPMSARYTKRVLTLGGKAASTLERLSPSLTDRLVRVVMRDRLRS